MNHVFFFQTQQIHDNTNLFDQLKKQNIFYSYFQNVVSGGSKIDFKASSKPQQDNVSR